MLISTNSLLKMKEIVTKPQPTTQREAFQAWHWDFVRWRMALVGNTITLCLLTICYCSHVFTPKLLLMR